ncbi:alpha/beta fold hydrolase [Corynebacterium sp. HMSC074A01]|uniref:alpha/beta fold hydrolase n=1 Tax=Corynebacterium sp. HMSC074A01 TaxID=1715030 RepID=UPI0008A10308|nr:alpha/beta fold hydrolase [Corynebacterium sp. HMSC074A01]OHF36810.1 proline iminopeptidase [Corynebacterium sp. HMSC074A01]
MESTVEITRDQWRIFARVMGQPDAPALLFLQGGPGSPAPRERFEWIQEALRRGYRVVLLDQRGTGRSTRIDAATPELITAETLVQLRAPEIIKDAEAIREALGITRWDVLGQSFGGFCLLHYLATAPERIGVAVFTGGLASISEGPDAVYEATFAKLRTRHRAFNLALPEAERMIREVCRHLATTEETLPTGERLTPRRFRTIGIELGQEGGFASLANLLEAPFHPNGRLRTDFLAAVGQRVSFAPNPLYAAIHESIYGGTVAGATDWSAERVSRAIAGFGPDATPDDDEFYLTGEHIFPFQFDEDPALRPFTDAAHALVAKDDWANQYAGIVDGVAAHDAADGKRVAAVYTDDIYVPRELSLETARTLGIDAWETAHYQHDGLRKHGAAVLGQLLDRAAGTN